MTSIDRFVTFLLGMTISGIVIAVALSFETKEGDKLPEKDTLSTHLAVLAPVPNESGTWVDLVETSSTCIYIIRWAGGATATSTLKSSGGCK